MKIRSFYKLLAAVMLMAPCTAAQSQGTQTPAPQAPAGQTVAPQAATSQESAEVTTLKDTVQRLQNRLNDWPQLARYREADGKVTAPQKKEKRVVFLGDSITDSWQRPNMSKFFAADGPNANSYIDRGISGQTTPQMLVRMHDDVIALQPKVVVILAGTNDIAGNTGPMTLEETEANITTICELARAHKVRVVLSSVLPVSDYGHNAQGAPIQQSVRRPPEKILELNHWIAEFAAANRHTYLDYFTSMVDDKGMFKAELSEDGLHPNAAGYAVMEPLVEKAISTAMKKKP